MNKSSAFQLTVSFLVIIIIAIIVFSSSIYIFKRFFTHAETIKMTYDERTEKEIERLLDDGSKVAIPFDKKTIGNGEFKTFGIGILNTMSQNFQDRFEVTVTFNKAFDRRNDLICDITSDTLPVADCGFPDRWLQTTGGIGGTIQKTVKNNEQEKFLLGVSVNNAPPGTYIFDLMVCVEDRDTIDNNPSLCTTELPDPYDVLHKLYVEVP